MANSRERFIYHMSADTICLILFLLAVPSFGQSFKVCTFTDSQRNEKGCGNRFILKADTLTLNLIVDLGDRKVTTDTVKFSFYKYDDQDIEEFISEVPLRVNKSSSYFYMPIDFYNEGSYFVKVSKKDSTPLVEGNFTIIYAEEPDKEPAPKK